MLTVRDTPAAPSPPTILLPESTQGVSVGMIAVKVYAFGGLAFVVGVIVLGFGWWFWEVVIKRQARDFPPDLENYVCSSIPLQLIFNRRSPPGIQQRLGPYQWQPHSRAHKNLSGQKIKPVNKSFSKGQASELGLLHCHA